MDAQRQALARACLKGSEDGTMNFPQIVGRLIEAGFDGYAVDLRRATATYYLPDGDSLELAAHAVEGAVAAAFDASAVRAAIGEAQAGGPGYSYSGFCAKVKAAGCAGYLVSFPGRRVLYYGRSAETHVEFMPG